MNRSQHPSIRKKNNESACGMRNVVLTHFRQNYSTIPPSGQKMQKYIIVKNIQNEEKELILMFNICGKMQRMVRSKSQKLNSTLSRIKINKKKLSGVENEPRASLLDFTGKAIDESETNLQGFTKALTLVLDNETYNVHHDSITLKSFFIQRFPMQRMEVEFTLDIEGVDVECIHLKWFREEQKKDVFLSNSRSYIPTQEDVGKHLKLRCFPVGTDDIPMEENCFECRTKDAVLPYTGPFLYEFRFIKKCDQDRIRVISYNILADYYSNTELAATFMYPKAPPYCLNSDYRKRILIKELEHYLPHILGIQECEQTLFDLYLYPRMRKMGYEGAIFTKNTNAKEGAAIFYNNERFSFLYSYDMEISSCLDVHPSCHILRETLVNNPNGMDLYYSTLGQKSVMQVLLLHDNQQDRDILVVNTHFYFAPEADAIRLIQASVVLNYANWLKIQVEQDFQKSAPAIILLGDLNSSPDSAAVELILTRSLCHNIHILPDPYIAQVLKSNIFLFCGSGFPKFTTYVACFNGLLDYVFVDGINFSEDTIAYGIPPENLVLKYETLPAPHTPSDHLPVICDLKYKNNG